MVIVCLFPAGTVQPKCGVMEFKTIIEPFRIKMVEPIRLTSESDRIGYLEAAHYNPFLLSSDQVIIDLLTDSGTSAMSKQQWAALMLGDESYAGAESWFRLENTIRDLTGMPYILPTHQGRAAERILYGYLGRPGKVFISNTHFDTTRANIEFTGAEAIDIPDASGVDNLHFKGNLDVQKLRSIISEKRAENIAAVILTVTNNSGGGQPVSMENGKAVAEVCRENDLLFVLDGCRIAENAYFIKHFEPGYGHYSYKEIARQMCALADGFVMSAKKDGMVNIGGFLSLRDEKLADACKNLLIITEGFTTYGGLAGRDMEALAVGLEEVFSPDYLHYRIVSTAYLGDHLNACGVPVILPVGGHAVYIDARSFYPHIPVEQYPGQALVVELYRVGGIRSVEVGSVMFGKYDDHGKLIPAARDLVRLALPRRVYTQSHLDYVIEVFAYLVRNKEKVNGFRITREAAFLRHFTAHFEPVSTKVNELLEVV